MRRLITAALFLAIATSTLIVTTPRPAEAAPCSDVSVYYFADASCNSIVGESYRDCSGAYSEDGTQTAYYSQSSFSCDNPGSGCENTPSYTCAYVGCGTSGRCEENPHCDCIN